MGNGMAQTKWPSVNFMKKNDIGVIFEIETVRGHSYGMITNIDKNYGEVVRIADEVFSEKLSVLEEIADLPMNLIILFPVRAAAKRGMVKILGRCSVPLEKSRFPVFRSGLTNPLSKRVEIWSLYDGEKTWIVEEADEEILKLPILSSPSFPLLKQWIEEKFET